MDHHPGDMHATGVGAGIDYAVYIVADAYGASVRDIHLLRREHRRPLYGGTRGVSLEDCHLSLHVMDYKSGGCTER